MRTKKLVMCNKQILFSFLVIALSTVIAVNCISDTAPETAPSAGDSSKKTAVAETQPAIQPPKSEQISAKSEPDSAESLPVADKAADSAKLAGQEAAKAESEVAKRKARAESPSASAAPAEAKPAEKASSAKAPAVEAKAAPKAAASKQASSSTPASSSASSSASGTKLAAKSKLPANLGTVTSTGSGGPAHYMSKHDAYSAIAEKHGALAQDAMRKSDKRQLQGFGGIQKASGIGDMLAPFKSVSDSGLARTLGASMRSIMKSKYSVPAYVASALLGAVALMAFYESPISPLPVPALPEPPVGRFPPEMPNISPNVQVPFRTNQQQFNQQNYNQRSLYSGIPQLPGQNYLGQQAQQVLFPGSSNNNNAQQRQMSAGSTASGPVQLAANLLGKPTAQRKSGVDFDQSSSRSFFSPSTATAAQPKQGTSSGSVDSKQQKQGSFLSLFGLGGGAAPAAPADLPSAGKMAAQAALAAAAANNNNNNNNNQVGQMGALNTLEPKGQAAGLYNSNLVNKFKSFFSRSPAQPASAVSSFFSAHPLGPYDQYQRMSFVQALLKDNNFLPGFLTPSRKSSSTPTGPAQSASASNKLQMVTNAIASATSGTSPTARMQVSGDSNPLQPTSAQSLQQGPANKQKQSASSGGYGFARAADRIAHALLETFTSGIAQRSNPSGQSASDNNSARKSSSNDEMSQSSSSPISSILSDVISSAVYSAANIDQQQPQQQATSEQATSKSAASQHQSNQQQHNSSPQQSLGSQEGSVPSGRSLDGPASEEISNAAPAKQTQQQAGATNNKQQSPANSAAPASEVGLVRKTRSIGLEYPIESNQELVQREQQPSKAAQINNVIDFVADSYSQNRLLFNFVMNQVGLSHAVPYVEQILASDGSSSHHH